MRLFRSPIVLLALAMVAGPAPAVTAQSPSPSTPSTVPFAGRIAFGDCTGGSTVIVDGLIQTRGEVCDVPVLEMSDPRLDGEVTVHDDNDVYPDGLALFRWAFRIENDGGIWQQQPVLTVKFPDGTYSTATITLIGEGGYDGLTAVAEVAVSDDIWSLDGQVFEGEVPSPATVGASPAP